MDNAHDLRSPTDPRGSHRHSDSPAARVAAWFSLREEDRNAAAVTLHALRARAIRIVAARCQCGITIAEDHVDDAVFVMIYGIRRVPQLRISCTTTLAYLCGVARNEWRWQRWRLARAIDGEEHDGPRTWPLTSAW